MASRIPLSSVKDTLQRRVRSGWLVTTTSVGAPTISHQAVSQNGLTSADPRRGGVTLETVGAYADTGADLISIGALTNSAPNLDIGLDLPNGLQPAAAVAHGRVAAEPAPDRVHVAARGLATGLVGVVRAATFS